MNDLTDIKLDIIIACPDAKSMTAFNEFKAALKSEEQANFSVVSDTYVISAPDPLGTLDEKRKEFIELLGNESESVRGIARLRFRPDGTIAMIYTQVNDPEDDK